MLTSADSGSACEHCGVHRSFAGSATLSSTSFLLLPWLPLGVPVLGKRLWCVQERPKPQGPCGMSHPGGHVLYSPVPSAYAVSRLGPNHQHVLEGSRSAAAQGYADWRIRVGYPGASPELAICCLGGDTHLGTFPLPSSSFTVQPCPPIISSPVPCPHSRPQGIPPSQSESQSLHLKERNQLHTHGFPGQLRQAQTHGDNTEGAELVCSSGYSPQPSLPLAFPGWKRKR